MKLTHSYTIVPVSFIRVDRPNRQRRELTTEDLEASIKINGLIHPPVITRDGLLISGERRYMACRALGWANIPVHWAEDMTTAEQQILELEENAKRRDLTWQENLQATKRVHEIFLAEDPDWTLTETAERLGISLAWLSTHKKLWPFLDDPKIMGCDKLREAYNIIVRQETRAQADDAAMLFSVVAEIMQDKDSGGTGEGESPSASGDQPSAGEASPIQETGNISRPPGLASQGILTNPMIMPAPSIIAPILVRSFLEWAPRYSGPKFNLIHCDFPYGVNLFDGAQGRGAEPTAGYVDTPEVYWELLDCLCENLDRLMSISGHLVFWYSSKYGNQRRTQDVFAAKAPSLDFQPHDLIWHKTDNAGIAPDARRDPRHVYETAMLASRSSRQIIQTVGDCYGAPTEKTLHPSTKPEPMLRHFFRMFVDDATNFLDPTAGSGASLRAADSLGAKLVVGLEINPGYAEVANAAFIAARRKRDAASEIERWL